MDKIKRNALCPCGSGKKYKKCCLNKKARTFSLTVDFGIPTSVDSFSFDPLSGSVSFRHKGNVLTPKDAWITTGYQRTKSPKILQQLPARVSDLTIKAHNALKGYDLISLR